MRFIVPSSLIAVLLASCATKPQPTRTEPVGSQNTTAGDASTSDGGEAAAPSIPAALAHMGAKNYPAAIAILRVLVAREPENGRAHLVLASALQQSGAVVDAIAVLHRAAEMADIRGRAYFQLGVIYTVKKDVDEAFKWLDKARDSGQIDVTQIGANPKSAILRADPRFAKLFPSAAEYADPFVERVKVLREWVGEKEGDQFGWIARNIGDVDGDGVNDLTTSAPTNGDGGKGAGKIYVYSGRSGALLWAQKGSAGASLGIGIEAAGDVDGDRIPDVIAGAPGIDKAVVYSGRDGKTLLTLSGEAKGDSFGGMVTDVGDVDGDGHGDVMVGAAGNDGAGKDAGSAYLYSGKDGTLLATWRGQKAGDGFGSAGGGATVGRNSLIVIGAPNAGPKNSGRVYVYRGAESEPAFVIESDDKGANLGGMFVSVVGDVDADGVMDVYASDWSHRAKGPRTGRVYIHSGADGHRLFTLTGEAAGDGFGIGTADSGDVDGDGHDDLLIGAWQQADGAPSGGRVYLYRGKDGSLIKTYTAKVSGETFGFDTTGMGDVDGDGSNDFLLTSAWSAIRGTRTGRMFIISGKL